MLSVHSEVGYYTFEKHSGCCQDAGQAKKPDICVKTISVLHLRSGPNDPFTKTEAFLGATQLDCDACQECNQFPGQ